MKSVIFIKDYFRIIPEGTETDVSDEDFLEWEREGYVQQIPFLSGRGVWIKSLADLQKRKKESENYNKAKAAFANTYLKEKQQNARCDIVSNFIVDEYKIKTIRDSKGEEFWYKVDGVYQPNGHAVILETAYDFFGDHISATLIAKIELLTKAKTFVDPSIFFNNVDRHRIGVANGILNVTTYELEEYNPRSPQNIFVRIPVSFDKSAKCLHFEAFLADILEKSEHVNAIQELLGFCLLPNYTYEKLFILTGKGRNGKSKLLSIFKTFLGPHNCTSHSLQTLQNKEFCLSDMHNKLANVGGDISNEALKSTDIVKQITGQDLISANRKFKDYISFVSYAKQIFACNELPIIYDSSLGFWNRINRLDFPYTFYEQNELKTLTEEQMKYAKVRNENILANITTASEMSGILNYALLGLELLRKQGEFSNSTETEITRSNWLRRTSSFYAFVSDMFDYDSNACVCSEHINTLYDRYCDFYTLEQVSPNARAAHIRQFANKTVVSVIRKNTEGDVYRVWKGMRLKECYEKVIMSNTGTLESFNQVTPVTAVTAILEKIDFSIMNK
jgi:P4 family phage/plasmid primase-like protien